MATPRTAPLYGCTVDSGWKACELKAPRGGFFTTVGFLSSRPQGLPGPATGAKLRLPFLRIS